MVSDKLNDVCYWHLIWERFTLVSVLLAYLKARNSSGTVFAWDLRWQQQPIILSGVEIGEVSAYSPCESEVWEVQYDNYMHSKNIGNMSSSRILPVMICSEDGILDVVEQGMDFLLNLFWMLKNYSLVWKAFKPSCAVNISSTPVVRWLVVCFYLFFFFW